MGDDFDYEKAVGRLLDGGERTEVRHALLVASRHFDRLRDLNPYEQEVSRILRRALDLLDERRTT